MVKNKGFSVFFCVTKMMGPLNTCYSCQRITFGTLRVLSALLYSDLNVHYSPIVNSFRFIFKRKIN